MQISSQHSVWCTCIVQIILNIQIRYVKLIKLATCTRGNLQPHKGNSWIFNRGHMQSRGVLPILWHLGYDNNTNLEMYYKELSTTFQVYLMGCKKLHLQIHYPKLQDLSNVGWKWVVIKEELNYDNLAYIKHIMLHYHRKLRAFVYIDRKMIVCHSYLSSKIVILYSQSIFLIILIY